MTVNAEISDVNHSQIIKVNLWRPWVMFLSQIIHPHTQSASVGSLTLVVFVSAGQPTSSTVPSYGLLDTTITQCELLDHTRLLKSSFSIVKLVQ